MNRYVAHIILEAETPLKVGSNVKDFVQDAPVQKDFNNLPMILGTSIAGVLRKDFQGNATDVFGEKNGSKVIISNALLLDENGRVHEKLMEHKSEFLQFFEKLPIREHTAINAKGVAVDGSKFDEEIVFKGSQFKFSLELIDESKSLFEEILSLLINPTFRLGSGSTKGFGSMKIIAITTQEFDLNEYVNFSSSLNYHLSQNYLLVSDTQTSYTHYKLQITPDDFFIFGSGFGDEDADATPVYEESIDYAAKTLSKKQLLIPASSIKGAISHRTTFHYNKQKGFSIENGDGVGVVTKLFGEAKNSKKDKTGCKGKLLISDCFMEDNKQEKVFDHVAIDRFTGGAIDGALFQEKTIADKREYTIDIFVDEKELSHEAVKAFELALKDITTGMLALGGMTTKGHGIFQGVILKNGKEISNG